METGGLRLQGYTKIKVTEYRQRKVTEILTEENYRDIDRGKLQRFRTGKIVKNSWWSNRLQRNGQTKKQRQ